MRTCRNPTRRRATPSMWDIAGGHEQMNPRLPPLTPKANRYVLAVELAAAVLGVSPAPPVALRALGYRAHWSGAEIAFDPSFCDQESFEVIVGIAANEIAHCHRRDHELDEEDTPARRAAKEPADHCAGFVMGYLGLNHEQFARFLESAFGQGDATHPPASERKGFYARGLNAGFNARLGSTS